MLPADYSASEGITHVCPDPARRLFTFDTEAVMSQVTESGWEPSLDELIENETQFGVWL